MYEQLTQFILGAVEISNCCECLNNYIYSNCVRIRYNLICVSCACNCDNLIVSILCSILIFVVNLNCVNCISFSEYLNSFNCLKKRVYLNNYNFRDCLNFSINHDFHVCLKISENLILRSGGKFWKSRKFWNLENSKIRNFNSAPAVFVYCPGIRLCRW